ncbi:MAG: GNAT family N-acetyltransferase [Actinomycetota bacterium]|nr:GNAT family N-acetyltransferase [Actinomycetota bacterium]
MPLHPAERIELRGLVLQRETVADAERVARAVADNLSHLAPWMAWAVPEASASSVQRERLAAAMKRWQDGTEYGYLLLARDSDELLGMCGLHRGSVPEASSSVIGSPSRPWGTGTSPPQLKL